MWDYNKVRIGIVTEWCGDRGHLTPIDSPDDNLGFLLRDGRESRSNGVEVSWLDTRGTSPQLRAPAVGEKVVFESTHPTRVLIWGYMWPYYNECIELDRRWFRIIVGNVVAWQGSCSLTYQTPLVSESRDPFPSELARTSCIEELVPARMPAGIEPVEDPIRRWRVVADRIAVWNRLLEASRNPVENNYTPPPLRWIHA